MYCPKCGTEIREAGSVYCGGCGYNIGDRLAAAQEQGKDLSDKTERNDEISEKNVPQDDISGEPTENIKKKKKILPAVILIGLLVIGMVVFFVARSVSGREEKINNMLSLGNRYLDELDYEQALVSYQAVLDIEPANADAYLGIVEVYIRQNEFETALEYAEKGYEITGDERLKEKIDMINSGNITDSRGNRHKMTNYDPEGNIVFWHEYTYDENGQPNGVTSYDAGGNRTSYVDETPGEDYTVSYWYGADGVCGRIENKIDELGRTVKSVSYDLNGDVDYYEELEYRDDTSICIKRTRYSTDGVINAVNEYEYDDQDREIKMTYYYVDSEGNLVAGNYQTREYDEDGKLYKYSGYDSEGNLEWYHIYEYDRNGVMTEGVKYDGEGNVLSREKME